VHRDLTIAREIVDDLEKHHQAPECYREPESATTASDVFSAGLVMFELFTNRPAFQDSSEVFDREARFRKKPSEYEAGLSKGFDDWLQGLCAFDPANRPDAGSGRKGLEGVLRGMGR
jgi:serine/threonine protein kinase